MHRQLGWAATKVSAMATDRAVPAGSKQESDVLRDDSLIHRFLERVFAAASVRALAAAAVAICFLTVGVLSVSSVEAQPAKKTNRSGQSNASSAWLQETEPGISIIGKTPQFGKMGQINDFSVSPDGKTLAISGGSTIKMWNIAKKKVMDTIKIKGSPYFTEYSPDGRRLGFVTYGGSGPVIKIWDAITGTEEITISLQPTESESETTVKQLHPSSMSFSPDGDRILVTGHQLMGVWDIETGDKVAWMEKTGYLRNAVFNQDGDQILGSNGKIWDATTGESLKPLPRRLLGRGAQSAAFNLSRNLFAVGAWQKGVIVIDLDSEQQLELESLEGNHQILNVAFSDDGSMVAAATTKFALPTPGRSDQKTKPERKLMIWDIDSGKMKNQLELQARQQFQKMRFSADGRYIFAKAYGQYGLSQFDLESGDESKPSSGLNGPAVVLQFDPNGKQIVAASQLGELVVFDAKTGEPKQQLEGPQNQPRMIKFSESGKRMVVASYYNDIRLFDWDQEFQLTHALSMGYSNQRSLLQRLTGAFSEDQQQASFVSLLISDVNFSPDGDELHALGSATQMQQYMYRQWSASSGKQNSKKSHRLKKYLIGGGDMQPSYGHNRPESISADGSLFAAVIKKQVLVCDAATGDLVHEFELAEEANLKTSFFSDDNRQLVTISSSDVTVWDLESGEAAQELDIGGEKIHSFGRSSNGRYLALVTAGRQGTNLVTVWDTESWEQVFRRSRKTGLFQLAKIAVSEKGDQLGFAQQDCRVEIWDLVKLKKQ